VTASIAVVIGVAYAALEDYNGNFYGGLFQGGYFKATGSVNDDASNTEMSQHKIHFTSAADRSDSEFIV
jgi:hypothetical protein